MRRLFAVVLLGGLLLSGCDQLISCWEDQNSSDGTTTTDQSTTADTQTDQQSATADTTSTDQTGTDATMPDATTP
jgi:uncharacterized protein YceK